MTALPRENVQSYPRPPALEPVPQRIMIRLGGILVADTTRALRVLETHHAPTYYLPPQDITATLLPAIGNSFCEWKGVARYCDVLSGDRIASRRRPLKRMVNRLAGFPETSRGALAEPGGR